jgi:acetyl esterase/lipase
MTTMPLVRPELRPFLAAFPMPTMNAESLAQFRSNPLPVPEAAETPDLDVSERRIPGPADAPQVRVLIYRPTNVPGPMPAILHIHGGGYIIGSPDMSDLGNRALASELGCVVVAPAYRLAPETPFPGPLEDCYSALKWLHDNASALGVDPARIAVKGESAGGGLAAGLTLLARDRGEVPIAFQCLTYPMIDDRPAADPHPHVGEFVWNRDSNHFGWSAYLGRDPGGDGVSPYAAPARAEELRGLPPALIIAGALDLFLEEDLEYARRLTRAGVPVELHVYAGAYHGFQIAADSEIGRRYHRDCRQALAEALQTG